MSLSNAFLHNCRARQAYAQACRTLFVGPSLRCDWSICNGSELNGLFYSLWYSAQLKLIYGQESNNSVLLHVEERQNDLCVIDLKAQGSISQRVKTSPNLGLVLGYIKNVMANPKLGRVTRPNSR